MDKKPPPPPTPRSPNIREKAACRKAPSPQAGVTQRLEINHANPASLGTQTQNLILLPSLVGEPDHTGLELESTGALPEAPGSAG